MFTKPALSQIPLPTGWPRRVRSAVVHTISLAQTSLTHARSVAVNSINARSIRGTPPRQHSHLLDPGVLKWCT